jgi:hypothetical protein
VVYVAYAVHVSVDVYIAISYAAVYAFNALDIASAGRWYSGDAERLLGRKVVYEAIVEFAVEVERCAGVKVNHSKGAHHGSKLIAILVDGTKASVGESAVCILDECLNGEFLSSKRDILYVKHHACHHPTEFACGAESAAVGMSSGTRQHHVAECAWAHTVEFVDGCLVYFEFEAVYLR